jgi:hypothetical protein
MKHKRNNRSNDIAILIVFTIAFLFIVGALAGNKNVNIPFRATVQLLNNDQVSETR